MPWLVIISPIIPKTGIETGRAFRLMARKEFTLRRRPSKEARNDPQNRIRV